MEIRKILIVLLAYCFFGVCYSFAATVPAQHATSSSRRNSVVSEMAGDSEGAETMDSSKTESSAQLTEETSLNLLDDSLGFNSTAASQLLAEINALRTESSQDQLEAYLNNLLTAVEATGWWTRIRPLARFSRRARRASLRRVLALSTPDADSDSDDDDAKQRRKRRSLVILLRALADDSSDNKIPAILQLEKAARRERKSVAEAQDMANRLPEGLETPEYSVLATSKSGYEIRRYQPFTVCSVAMNKPRPSDVSKTDAKVSNPQLAGAGAFGALAGYLFGKNQESTAMKMTTPVLSTGEGTDRQMSFVLPSEYWKDIQKAPKPFEESGVVLQTKEGGERAVVMFGGFAGKKDVKERTKQLLDGLAKDKEWMVEDESAVSLLQYNDPFTPPWKRRNEVSVEVVRRQES